MLVWVVFLTHLSTAHAASTDLTLDRPLPAKAQAHVDQLVNKAIEQESAYKASWLALGHYDKTLDKGK